MPSFVRIGSRRHCLDFGSRNVDSTLSTAVAHDTHMVTTSPAKPSETEVVLMQSGFDLAKTYVHLGLGSRATPIPDFEWTPEFLARYATVHGSDGVEGRLVMIGSGDSSWTSWERHPA